MKPKPTPKPTPPPTERVRKTGGKYAEPMHTTALDTVSTPSPEMIDAGLDELNLALGKPAKHDRTYRRQLVITIFRAMIGRARL